MAQKVCSKCGEDNPISAMVCGSCGNSLSHAKIIGTDNKVILETNANCPQCKEQLKDNVRNCPNCGTLIAKSIINSKASSIRHTRNTSSGNVFLFIIALLIPLIGFIAGAINLASNDSDKKESGVICIILGLVSSVIGGVLIKIITG